MKPDRRLLSNEVVSLETFKKLRRVQIVLAAARAARERRIRILIAFGLTVIFGAAYIGFAMWAAQ